MRSSRRFIVALTSALFAAAQASAQQDGTATAVNQLSESTPPGGATAPLMGGVHIGHKERVHTTPAGTVQLLFTDKSSMSIAPNTDIVIDEYVYDPNANNGHMLVSLTKGALRFVGGQLSHQGEATITTSAANIGIRGGTVTVAITPNGTRVINHYGVITIQNGAGTTVLKRPDFAATITSWNTPPGLAERVSGDEIAHYQKITVSQKNQDGGVPGLKHVLVIDHVRPPPPTDNGQQDAFQTINQATQRGTATTPLPRFRGN